MISFESEEDRAVGEVVVPGGLHVGAFVGAPDLILDMDEAEILLPRESRFRLVNRLAADYIQLEVILR